MELHAIGSLLTDTGCKGAQVFRGGQSILGKGGYIVGVHEVDMFLGTKPHKKGICSFYLEGIPTHMRYLSARA
jgi:hypothetical protein